MATSRLVPAARIACRMLAVPADMIDEVSREMLGPRAETTAPASATAGSIAAGSSPPATTTASRSWRTGSLAGSLTTAVRWWPAARACHARWRPVLPLAPKIVSCITSYKSWCRIVTGQGPIARARRGRGLTMAGLSGRSRPSQPGTYDPAGHPAGQQPTHADSLRSAWARSALVVSVGLHGRLPVVMAGVAGLPDAAVDHSQRRRELAQDRLGLLGRSAVQRPGEQLRGAADAPGA